MTKEILGKAGLTDAGRDKHPDLTRKQVVDIMESVIGVVTTTLAEGGEISISGFGKFAVVARSVRAGRNPATGEAIKIAASTTPKFTAGKALKEAVNVKKSPAREVIGSKKK